MFATLVHLALCSPFVVGRPEVLGIKGGTYQKESSVPFVGSGSGMCKGWFYWLFCTSRCVSFPVVRPKMLGTWAGMDQKDSHVVCSLQGRRHPCRGQGA